MIPRLQFANIATKSRGEMDLMTPNVCVCLCVYFAIASTRDLYKTNLIWQFDLRLEPIFATASAASKKETHFKSSSKWPENNHIYIPDT